MIQNKIRNKNVFRDMEKGQYFDLERSIFILGSNWGQTFDLCWCY